MKKHNGSNLIIRIILFLFLISTVLPLLIMIFTSLKDETQILQNFCEISSSVSLGELYRGME